MWHMCPIIFFPRPLARVRTLQGIAFRSAFPLTRLTSGAQSKGRAKLVQDNMRRASLHMHEPTVDMSEYVFLD